MFKVLHADATVKVFVNNLESFLRTQSIPFNPSLDLLNNVIFITETFCIRLIHHWSMLLQLFTKLLKIDHSQSLLIKMNK